MAEYIKRESAIDAVLDVFYDTTDIDLSGEKLEAAILNVQAADVEPVQEWILVDDRLPEDDSDVLAYSRIGEESRIYPACYSNGVWFDCVFNALATDTTTHWMPLPEPPKGE